jgi:hypothetical protein
VECPVEREPIEMDQIADGWEIVSRRTNEPGWLLSMLAQIMVAIPVMPPYFSSVTWTVRETATGAIRSVTARTEQDAKDKIACGLFDGE